VDWIYSFNLFPLCYLLHIKSLYFLIHGLTYQNNYSILIILIPYYIKMLLRWTQNLLQELSIWIYHFLSIYLHLYKSTFFSYSIFIILYLLINLHLILCLIEGNAHIVAGLVSSCLPPWLLIHMASTPFLYATYASSGWMIPFNIIFNFVFFLI
jgi:hypothetical protein